MTDAKETELQQVRESYEQSLAELQCFRAQVSKLQSEALRSESERQQLLSDNEKLVAHDKAIRFDVGVPDQQCSKLSGHIVP